VITGATERLRPFVTLHAAGARTTLHRHSAPYVAFVLEGGYEERSIDGLWRCEAGDLVIHPPMHLHVNDFTGRRSRVLNFILPSKTPAHAAHSYGVWRPRDPDAVRRLNGLAADEIAEVLAGAVPAMPIAPGSALSGMAERLASDPRCRIGDRQNHPATTREHASRAFRRHFGFPPAVFRSEQRFRAALQLLADFTRSLVSVALDAGYADQAHLTRDFRARTGASPGAFRRALRLERRITSVQS
jgi:AraC-like DNA-binding protein